MKQNSPAWLATQSWGACGAAVSRGLLYQLILYRPWDFTRLNAKSIFKRPSEAVELGHGLVPFYYDSIEFASHSFRLVASSKPVGFNQVKMRMGFSLCTLSPARPPKQKILATVRKEMDEKLADKRRIVAFGISIEDSQLLHAPLLKMVIHQLECSDSVKRYQIMYARLSCPFGKALLGFLPEPPLFKPASQKR